MKNEKLISGKLIGSLSAEDLKRFEYLLENEEGFRDEYELYLKIWDTSSKNIRTKNTDISSQALKSWEQMEHMIEEAPTPKRSVPMFRVLSRVAAVAILILGVVFIYRTTNQETFEIGQVISVDEETETLFALADGSEIYLDQHSQIEVDQAYNRETRTTRLNGNAFFVVKPDKDRAFEVVTNHLKATVKGTTFLIRTDDHSTTVGVRTGIVNVQVGDQIQTLKAGDQILVTANSGMIKRSVLEVEPIDELLSESRNFKNVSLQSIAKQVENLFSIRLQFPNDYLKQKYTVDLSDATQEEVIEILATLTQCKFEISEDIYIFTSKN